MARRSALSLKVQTTWASPRQIDAMLVAMLKEQGVEVVDVEISTDDQSDSAHDDRPEGEGS